MPLAYGGREEAENEGRWGEENLISL